jgi:hypothetical protein
MFGTYENEDDYRYDQDFFEFEEDYLKDDEFRDLADDEPEINDDNEIEVFVDLLDEVGDMMAEDQE